MTEATIPVHVTIIQDLFDHNDWANARVLTLSESLTDSQLDAPRALGFGSLRDTLFHILECESLWLERWHGEPWRVLRTDAGGMSVPRIRDELQQTARQRNELLEREQPDGYRRVLEFRNSRGETSRRELSGLLNHVTNHGIHHRAQAINYLRGHGKTIPGGLDYLFWKVARPSCPFAEDSVAALRQYGLEVATASGRIPQFDRVWIERYFTYNDWATANVVRSMATLDEPQLDTAVEMGMGSLRKNLQHIIDAERWWLRNFQQELSPFPRGEPPRSLPSMVDQYHRVQLERNALISGLDATSADRMVNVSPGGPILTFRLTESLLQLCGHATHHRAQCLNMLRQLGADPPGIDFVTWHREQSPADAG